MHKTLHFGKQFAVAAILGSSAFVAQPVQAGYVTDTLCYTDFVSIPVEWPSGDIITAGTKNTEVEIDGAFFVGGGPNGQRMNRQGNGSVNVGEQYGPVSSDDLGVTPGCISWLKSSNGGYFRTAEAFSAPFSISMWLCTAKSASYTEKLEVSVSTDNENWTPIDTCIVTTCKADTRFDIDYEGTGDVYLKFTSISSNGSNNNMIMHTLLVAQNTFEASNIKAAYLYDATYSNYCGIDNDPVYNQSLGNYDATPIDISTFTADTDTSNYLCSFDVVVVSEAMSSGQAWAKANLVDLVNKVPILNTKSFFYKSGVFSWGAGVNPTKIGSGVYGVASMTVSEDFYTSPLFENITTDLTESNGVIKMFENETQSNNEMQAYTAAVGSLIENDSVISTVGGYNAMHKHGDKNTYLLLPMSSDAWLTDKTDAESINITEDAIQIFNNAIVYLAKTKSDVFQAVAPKFSYEYTDGKTYVAMSTLSEGANIYYTTDGSDPTTAGTIYSDTISITANNTALKAVAMDGPFSASEITVDTVLVKVKAGLADYSMSAVATGTQVVFIAPSEDAIVYANLVGSNDIAQSNAVDTLIFTSPCTVTIFAAGGDYLPSDIVTFAVEVADVSVMQDTLLHTTFDGWSTSELIADKYYNYYQSVASGDTTIQVPADSLTIRNEENWILGSYGQRVLVQNTGTETTIGANYGPEDIFSAGATKTALSFLVRKNDSDPASAYIQSTNAYQGPFDVATYITGQASASYYECVEVLVSSDTTNADGWVLVDTIGTYNLKTMHRGVATYTGEDMVFVKVKSATGTDKGSKYKTMLFDVVLLGKTITGVENVYTENMGSQNVIATKYYNVAGQRVNQMQSGINIIMNVYADGSVKTYKVIKK